MTESSVAQPTVATRLLSILAVLFGLMTIKSGASVLFFDGEARQAAGHYVPFVLWFNFCAGFIYIVAGIGLWRLRTWAAWLSLLLAGATMTVFAAFGLHILNGAEYESRTVFAMTLRSALWLVIAAYAWRRIMHNKA